MMSPLTATRFCHPPRMVTMSQKEFKRVIVIESAATERAAQCSGSRAAIGPIPMS